MARRKKKSGPFVHFASLAVSLPATVGRCMDTGTVIELFLWTVVAILGSFIYYRIKKIGRLTPTRMEIPPQAAPKITVRDYTPAELQEHTGADASKPILFSVKVWTRQKTIAKASTTSSGS